MKKIFLLILIIVIIGAVAFSQENDVRKLKWGMSYTQVKEIEGFKVTISLGVSSYVENMSEPGDLIEAADSCLYKAKNNGRNKIVSS